MTTKEMRANLEAQADTLEQYCKEAYEKVEFNRTRHGKGSLDHRVALKNLSEQCEFLRDTYRKIQALEKSA